MGDYFVQLTDTRGRTTLPFRAGRYGAEANRGRATQTLFPNARLDEDRRLVVHYPSNAGRRVYVELRDEAGETVFTDKIPKGLATTKAYQLQRLSAGTYTFSVAEAQHTIHRQRVTLR